MKKVIKVWAAWCWPCQQYKSTFESVTDKFVWVTDIELSSIDVDKDPDIAWSYRIMSVPTTIFINDNDEVIKKESWPISQDILIWMIESLLDTKPL